MTDAEKWIQEHEGELVEDICTLVRIPSVSESSLDPEAPFGAECRRALDAALKLGEEMGFAASNHENYCGSLCWKGTSEREIGFFGHTDVVPAGGGWTYAPFEPTVKDGIIIGRGSSDNKGSFMAALYALRYLKEAGYQPRHTMRFFLGCSEEKGMEDVQYYTSHYKEPDFSIVPDVLFPVCNGEKGILGIETECHCRSQVLIEFAAGIMTNAVPAHAGAKLRLSEEKAAQLKVKWGQAVQNVRQEDQGEALYEICAEGIPAHAAFPEGSDNAEVKLARMLLESGVLDESGRRLMEAISHLFDDFYGKGLRIPFEDANSGRLTHVGGIASYRDGVFRQNINIRYNITADYNTMIENIRTALAEYDFTMVDINNSSPCYTDADSLVVKRLTEICNQGLGTSLKPFVMGGGTYARRLKHAVGFGPGIPGKEKRFGTERGGAHQADEYVEIEDLKQAFLIYVEAVQALDEMV